MRRKNRQQVSIRRSDWYHNRHPHRQRGIALIAVLVVTAVVLTLATTFVASTGTTTTISRNIENHAQARRIAESGIRMTLAYIGAEEDWRTLKSEGDWLTGQSFAGGTFDVMVNDGNDGDGDGVIAIPGEGDGDLGNNEDDVFTITSTATFSAGTYTARAVVTPEPASLSIKVLFVVRNKSSLSAQENAKKALLESWDFSVELISANESQSAFDSAVADANVAYVSEETTSSLLGAKLVGAPIGVVNEEQIHADDYGFSSLDSCYTSTDIDVVDNTHYITSALSSGSLSILTGSSSLHTAHGTLGGGALVLAEQPSSSNPVLLAIDTGGALYGGGAAAGRRVHLPWGCNDFDFDELNDDGKTILKRSLEWASPTPTLNSAILHYDFDEQSGTVVNDKQGSVDLSFVTGNGTLNWVTDAQAGTGLYFDQDGQSGTASCKTSSTTVADSLKTALQATDAITIQAFVKAEELDNTGGRIVSYSRDSGSSTRNFSLMSGYGGSSGNDDLIGRSKNNSGNASEYRANDVWAMDEFHVLAYTVDHALDSDNVKLYVDGVLVDTFSSSGGDFSGWSSEHFLLGNEATNNRPFRGTMFDVKIWDEALRSDQLYNNAAELLSGSESDPQLIALYEFNEVMPDPQLTHHWELDDTGTTAEEGQTGLNGTVNGATPSQLGMVGDAYSFDGINDYIEIPHDSSLLLDDGSIALWFNSTDVSANQGLFSKDASGFGNGGHTLIYTSSSRVKVRLQSASSEYKIQSGTLSDNTWYHVVFSFGTEGMKLYLNGTEVATHAYQGGMGTTSGGSGNTEPFVFGANALKSGTGSVTPLSQYFGGRIDDVRIYDDALSDSQVANLHALQPLGAHGGPGTVVRDTSSFGSALDLTLTEPSDASWITGGGIELTASTVLSSEVAATKLYDALTATDEMTMEVKFAPANVTQGGPSRLVTYSSGTSNTNFTFGQEGTKIQQRLNTTSTGANGTPGVATGDVLSADTTEHFIVTYDGSDVKLYRNGSLETTTARTGTFDWNNGYLFVMGNETSNDRPWLGKLFRVAIYDRALSTAQVGDVFTGNAPSIVGPEGWAYNAHWTQLP